MCECGCGELRPIAKLRAPRGVWYFIEIYPGCNNGCGTSWGLTVNRLRESVRNEHEMIEGFGYVPEIKFGSYGQWAAPILDTKVLYDLYAAEEGEEEADMLDDFVERGGLRCVFAKTPHPAPAAGTEGKGHA